MTPQQISELRKEVKHLLVDHGLDALGSRQALADVVSKELSRPVNKNSLTMALTGYREEPLSISMLQAIKSALTRSEPRE